MAEWLGFIAIAALLVMAPGPNSLLIVQSVLSSGKKAGVLNILGILLGFLTQALMCVLGLAVVLAHSAHLIQWIKWAGAAVLIFLGISAIRATFKEQKSVCEPVIMCEQEPPFKSLLKGFATCILNPKISLFYISVLPQFASPERFVLEGMLLSVLHSMVAAAWFALLVLAVTRLNRWLSQPKINRRLRRTTGGFFIFLGTRTAWQA